MAPKQLGRRFGAPHYYINAVICAFYPALWLLPGLRLRLLHQTGDPTLSLARETQIICSVLAFGLFKVISLSSAEEQIEFIFLVSKITTAGLLYLHGQYKATSIYVALWFLSFIIYPQPDYRGASQVTTLSEDSLFEEILHRSAALPNPSTLSETKIWELAQGEDINDGDAESQAEGNEVKRRHLEAERDLVWKLVLFGTSWSAASRNLDVVLSLLSLDYACPQLRFYRIDPETFVDVATEFDISVGP